MSLILKSKNKGLNLNTKMKVEKLIISETHDQCSYCENKEDNDTGIVYKFGRTKIGLNVVSTICPNCLKELNKLVLNNFLKPIKGKLKIEWEDEENKGTCILCGNELTKSEKEGGNCCDTCWLSNN